MAFVLPELYINPEFSWGPPAEEMTLDGEAFQLYRKPDRSDRNDKPPLPVFDFMPYQRFGEPEAEIAVAKGGFKEVEESRRKNALASAKSKQTKPRQNYRNNNNNNNRNNNRRRFNNRQAKRDITLLPNTISIPSNADVLAEFDPTQLSKVPEADPLVTDLGLYSLPLVYDYQVEKRCAQQAIVMPEDEYRLPQIIRPDTRSDTTFRTLLKDEDPALPAIAITDEMLTLLMTANRSTHPWHLKVAKLNNRFLISRPEKENNVDKQWVGETRNHEFAPSEDAAAESERISSLGEESTRVHENFIRLCCTKTRANMRTNQNPFPQTQPRLYRYRRFTLNAGTPDAYNLIVRSELDAVGKNNEYMRLFGLLEQEMEGKDSWQTRIERKSSASILPDEFQGNSAKISRWVALSLLAGAATMKIGLISRCTVTSPGVESKKTPEKHQLQLVESIPPASLARQFNINYNAMWAAANLVLLTLIKKMTDQDGFIMKHNNRSVVLVEGVTGETDSDDDDSDDDDSDDEEDDSDDEDDDEEDDE